MHLLDQSIFFSGLHFQKKLLQFCLLLVGVSFNQCSSDSVFQSFSRSQPGTSLCSLLSRRWAQYHAIDQTKRRVSLLNIFVE